MTGANDSTPLLHAERGGGEYYEANFTLNFVESVYLYFAHRRLVTDDIGVSIKPYNGETVTENAAIGKENASTSGKNQIKQTVINGALVLLVLAWDAFVLYTTQKGCECKANIRLWVKMHMVTLGMIIIRLTHYGLMISVGWSYANESIDEVVSSWQPADNVGLTGTSRPSNRRFAEKLLQAMHTKYLSEIRCRWLLHFYYLLLFFVCIPLSVGGDVFGVRCLFLDFGACCNLPYVTCLAVVIGDMLYNTILCFEVYGATVLGDYFVTASKEFVHSGGAGFRKRRGQS